MNGLRECGETPFPGPLFAIYQVNTKCWYILYESGRAFTFAVGTAPQTSRSVLFYNEANGGISFVALPRGLTRPYIIGAKIPILVIGYRHAAQITRFDMRTGRLAASRHRR